MTQLYEVISGVKLLLNSNEEKDKTDFIKPLHLNLCYNEPRGSKSSTELPIRTSNHGTHVYRFRNRLPWRKHQLKRQRRAWGTCCRGRRSSTCRFGMEQSQPCRSKRKCLKAACLQKKSVSASFTHGKQILRTSLSHVEAKKTTACDHLAWILTEGVWACGRIWFIR